MDEGRVVGIFLTPEHGELPESVERAQALAGKGLEGNRYFYADGGAPDGRALTLIAAEALDAFERETNIVLSAAETRRNVLTRGVDVNVRVAEDEPSKPASDQRIVLLKEGAGERILPIWIHAAEGNMLAARLTGYEPPRPMTPDLMVELLRATGSRVERVEITALREKTFYATVSVAIDGR